MLSTRSRTTLTAALAAGLAISLSACGSNDETVGTEGGGAATQTSPTPVAALADLSKGESTAVTLDAGFLEGLTALKLTPATVGGAKLDGAVLSFPITGGNVTVFDPAAGVDPYIQGTINHEGSGLQLTGANGKVVKLENFVVDPGTSMLTGKVTVDGEEFAPSAPLFFLDGSTLKPLATEGTNAVLEGTTVSLTKTAADALNMVFETTVLTEFFKVGVAKIAVATA
jgi:hypothetical protein